MLHNMTIYRKIDHPAYPSCEMYNLDVVEKLFMKTYVYTLIKNKVSIDYEQQPFFKGYCKHWNEKIKNGIDFNNVKSFKTIA